MVSFMGTVMVMVILTLTLTLTIMVRVAAQVGQVKLGCKV